MMQTIGQICLGLALCFSFAQGFVAAWGYLNKNPYALACARTGALGQFLCISAACILLIVAFINNDFSIAYIASNSHPSLPFMYRLTALWGGHEGSILLWILMLNAWAIAYTYFEKENTSLPLVLSILGIICFCFLCFLIFTSNPFSLSTSLQTGRDLNPLLQDPGFVIHPPMLYAGYVGFSVAFAITLAALIQKKLDATWARITKQFAIAAWCFLTLGIMLGSWWAYRVLGWGGFWFWDPVENASLLPWITGTALIHVLLLTEKRGSAKGWAALLALICFALSLLGTFLVRSGVLISAHTFANDPERGVFLLLLLAILVTVALIIYLVRLPTLLSAPLKHISLASRDFALLMNSALLFIAMLTVLLGTLYPLVLDALHLGSISVGAPYFNLVMAPLVFITMAFMGFAPFSSWQEQSLKKIMRLSWKNALISLISAIILIWGFTHELDVVAILTLSLSFWILLSVFAAFRFLPGMAIAHGGFAILIIGIMLSSVLNQEKDIRIKPGDDAYIGPYQFLFLDTKGIEGSNYRGIQAAFDVIKNGRHITNMYPEKRIYLVRDMVMTKVDIHPGIFRDLYLALGEPLDKDYWSVRLYYKPFIRWIWAGGILMMLGGLLAIMQNRKKT